jgi:hypothetical protein
MIMFLDYVLYWVFVLFVFSMMDKIFKRTPFKTILTENLIPTGVYSLLLYTIIFYFGGGGFMYL